MSRTPLPAASMPHCRQCRQLSLGCHVNQRLAVETVVLALSHTRAPLVCVVLKLMLGCLRELSVCQVHLSLPQSVVPTAVSHTTRAASVASSADSCRVCCGLCCQCAGWCGSSVSLRGRVSGQCGMAAGNEAACGRTAMGEKQTATNTHSSLTQPPLAGCERCLRK